MSEIRNPKSEMPSLARILHPTDFSASSANAAEYACFLAEKFAAELHLLYVLEDSMAKVPDLTLGFPPPGGTSRRSTRSTKTPELACPELAPKISLPWRSNP